MPVCSACAADKPKSDYSKAQLAKKDARKCKACIAEVSSDRAAPAPLAPSPAPEAAASDAEAAKAAGNAALKAGKFAAAITAYSEAILLDGTNHIYFSNRSAAHLSAGDAASAAADAKECIALAPAKWAKGHSRLGAALIASGDFQEAVNVYGTALKLEPGNRAYMEGMIAAQKGVTQKLEADIMEQAAPDGVGSLPVAGGAKKNKVTGHQDAVGIAIGSHVEVHSLKSAAEHNGKKGYVSAYDAAKHRFIVELPGAPLSLKPKNIRLCEQQPEPEVGAGEGQVEEVTESSKVIGIDLGTTNSCVGVWIDDEVHILTSPEGRKTVPSFVAFDGDARLVGDEAKAQQTRNIANTIYDVKRIIGQRMSQAGVQALLKTNGVASHRWQADVSKLQYKVTSSGESDKPVVTVDYQGRMRSYSPEEISALVLTKMKKIAEDFLCQTVSRAVITVPAYFSDAQRAATQAAGRIAGLKVERIINEPTAAALAYGLDRTAEAAEEAVQILIFDLGGGTFDVSILKIEGGIFEVLATGGDTRLGGEDFDHAISDYVIKHIHKTFGVQLKDDLRAFKRLKVAAQIAKEELSNQASTTIDLEGLFDAADGSGPVDLSLPFTRQEFNKLITPYTKLCAETVKRVLKDAKLQAAAISEVVLVGGSTRIPIVQEELRRLVGRDELCKSVNPDECVAYGAAVQGAILAGERSDRTSALLLVDVTPLSLGVEVQGRAMSTIVKRNTPIPCSKKGMYTTCEDFQTSIDIAVYEGERSHVEGNNLLGEFTIDGIERAKRDVAKVEVMFEIDANGILTVTAQDKVTGVKNRVVIENAKGRLTDDEVEQMVADAAKFVEEDRLFSERLEARNELERLCYDMLNTSRDYDLEKLERKSLETQAWCDSVALTAETQDYIDRKLALEKLMRKLGI